MAIHRELFLHEEILLLALHDEKGTIETGSAYALAVGGAMLAELLVRRRVEMGGSGKKQLIQLVDAKPIGEPLLDEALHRIATAKRRAAPQTWVQRLGGLKRMRDRLADGLCRRGILRADEKDVLVFFKRRTYPAIDPEPERRIIRQLHEAIFRDSPVEPRTTVLLSLASATDLLRLVFDKGEIEERQHRIADLTANEPVGASVKSAIEEIQMIAVLAAIH